MEKERAVYIWNSLMTQEVGATNDEPVSKRLPLGFVAMGAGIPTLLADVDIEYWNERCRKVAVWLREFADALDGEKE